MRFVHDIESPRVVFGAGALGQVATEVAALGATRVVLVTGSHATAARAVVSDTLGDLLVGVVDQVVEHVPVKLAGRAAAYAVSREADLLVAVGGGSAIGTAKAVARAGGQGILAIPTTYAGSEMTPIWGLTEDGVKRTGRDPRVLPRTVVYDPDLILSLPDRLVASTGLNALAHCIEAAYAPDASPLVRIAAVEGARVLVGSLPRCLGPRPDINARTEALYGAWLAGLALGNATMGLHHKLCHVLGGQQRLAHGCLHSVLLPYTVAYNRQAAVADLAPLTRALGTDDVAGGIWDLGRRLGTPRGLTELGFDAGASDEVVDAVLAAPPTNPRPVDAPSLRGLLAAAASGARPLPPSLSV